MLVKDIVDWPKEFSPMEWPGNVLSHMDSKVLTDVLFPLRQRTGIPMSPSQLPAAHVRTDGSKRSQHYAVGRNSTATDMTCGTIDEMIDLMHHAEVIESCGGVGVYFDTYNPLIHLDTRSTKFTWLVRTNKQGYREYIYKQVNPKLFTEILNEEIANVGENRRS